MNQTLHTTSPRTLHLPAGAPLPRQALRSKIENRKSKIQPDSLAFALAAAAGLGTTLALFVMFVLAHV